MGENIHTIKKNTEALIFAAKETGLHLHSERTKYVVVSPDQNAGQNHNVRMEEKSFEMGEQFKYLGTSNSNKSNSRS